MNAMTILRSLPVILLLLALACGQAAPDQNQENGQAQQAAPAAQSTSIEAGQIAESVLMPDLLETPVPNTAGQELQMPTGAQSQPNNNRSTEKAQTTGQPGEPTELTMSDPNTVADQADRVPATGHQPAGTATSEVPGEEPRASTDDPTAAPPLATIEEQEQALQAIQEALNCYDHQAELKYGPCTGKTRFDTGRDAAGNVTSLSLSRSDYAGPIPAAIGQLVYLEMLHLHENRFTGELPGELGSLTMLKTLQVSENEISGSIPPEFENLKNLESLYLEDTQMSGELPSFLPEMEKLSHLIVNYEAFCKPPGTTAWARFIEVKGRRSHIATCGPQISELEQLAALVGMHQKMGLEQKVSTLKDIREVGLDARGHIITLDLRAPSDGPGVPIPKEIASFMYLEDLRLDGPFTGPIPAEIGNLANLSGLSIHRSMLSGVLPPEIGKLENLIGLFIIAGDIEGPIPSEIGNLKYLETIRINHTQLSGPIPPEIGQLTNLVHLNLRDNQLTGLPPEISNARKLGWLWVDNNQIEGELPHLSEQMDDLRYMTLSGNKFSGTIPASYGQLPALLHLSLADNQLSGAIPPELANAQNLQQLQLGGNQLSGNIPAELGNHPSLGLLHLQNNMLSGTVPEGLSVTELQIEGNKLTGTIPTAVLSVEGLRTLTYGDNDGLCVDENIRNLIANRDHARVEGPAC